MKKFTLLFVVFLAMTSAFGQDEGLTPPDTTSTNAGQVVITDPPKSGSDPIRSDTIEPPPVSEAPVNTPDPIRPQPDVKDWKSREEIEKAIRRCEEDQQVAAGQSRFYAGVVKNDGFSAADRAWARDRQRKAASSVKKLTATLAGLKSRLNQLEGRVDAHDQQLLRHDHQIEDLDGRTKSLEASRDAGKKRFDDYVGKTDRRLGSLEKERDSNLKGFNWLTIWLLVLTGGVVLGFFLRRR